MCSVLGVSKSGYYDWFERPESSREQENQKLIEKIRETHKASRGCYGSIRVFRKLKKDGRRCGKNRVARLMRKEGIKSKRRRKFRATTNSRHSFPVAPNLLERNFDVDAPNKVWASDITYIPTDEGWLYLATVMDLSSKRIVGWSMDNQITRKLAIDALEMAIHQRKPQSGLIHHSDRGSQYASSDYQDLLNANGIRCSMSRKGDCWDNAVMESFYSTLKMELTHHCSYRSRDEARREIFEYIEVFYNRQRMHSSLDYLTPTEYEMGAQAA